jgi:hypothetical protein
VDQNKDEKVREYVSAIKALEEKGVLKCVGKDRKIAIIIFFIIYRK